MRAVLNLIWRGQRRLLAPCGFAWRRLGLYARGVTFGPGLIVEPQATLDGAGEIHLGTDVWIGRGVYIHVWPGARLEIGDRTYLGRGSIVLCHRSVQIGAHCMVAPYAHITDVNHGIAFGSLMREQPLVARPVELGDDVWLGAGCSVLPGVRISEGCVVGARAVVSRDLPPYAIAVGVPARSIKYRNASAPAAAPPCAPS